MLASDQSDRRFAPEPFSALYQRGLYQSMRSLSGRVFHLLGRRLKDLPEPLRSEASQVMGLEKSILESFRSITQRKITAQRIRCHGDYHLGQVLYTGKDFVVIDFEGEPARPISERRIKRSPLRDVAGMLRSFHYALYSALSSLEARGVTKREDLPYVDFCAGFWYRWVSSVFLKAYLEVSVKGGFLPATGEELHLLLNAYTLEKAIYELGYELNNRPAWVKIPIRGILQRMSRSTG
jgi:maltose alpha-D-glucosyltransferase/alpha-amylase